jgi:hypothetical protein
LQDRDYRAGLDIDAGSSASVDRGAADAFEQLRKGNPGRRRGLRQQTRSMARSRTLAISPADGGCGATPAVSNLRSSGGTNRPVAVSTAHTS